jgi:hypothetical protein
MAVDLAAVVEALRQELEDNVSSFVLQFTPERSYADWDLKLEDADELHVDVALHSTEIETELATNGRIKYTVPIEVGIRKRFEQAEQESSTGRIALGEIDNLVLLVTQIHEFLCKDRLTDFDDAVWVETSIRAAYIPRHLKELRQFTGIVRLVYRIDRALA